MVVGSSTGVLKLFESIEAGRYPYLDLMSIDYPTNEELVPLYLSSASSWR